MSFTKVEKEALDEIILRWLREQPGKPWLDAGTIKSGIHAKARADLGLPPSPVGSPDTREVSFRLRALKQRGEVVNRPAESPYLAGNNEWRLA